tara:strand:+ start:214 stop:351 length:138 start_codon:yes stop_codon:yes gene_type:complete
MAAKLTYDEATTIAMKVMELIDKYNYGDILEFDFVDELTQFVANE